MPYIKPEHRKEVEDALEGVGLNFVPKDAGQLNYVITVLIDNYIRAYGKNCKQEYYRTIVGPYEDMKIDENGDV